MSDGLRERIAADLDARLDRLSVRFGAFPIEFTTVRSNPGLRSPT